MIRLVVAAVWICAVTIGSLFYAFQSSAAKTTEDGKPPAFFGGLDYVKTNVISVPVLKDGHVGGYFLTRLVYTVEPSRARQLSIPAEMLFTDEVYNYLFTHSEIDFTDRDRFDYDAFKTGIREAVNKRVGEGLVHDILIEQVDFLSKEDIRDNTIRRRATKDTEVIDAATKAKQGLSH